MKKIILVISISLLNIFAGFTKEDSCYHIEEKDDTCFIIFSYQCSDTLFLKELNNGEKIYGDGYPEDSRDNIAFLKSTIYRNCSSWLIWGIGTEKLVGVVLSDPSLDGKVGFIIPDNNRQNKKYYKFRIEKLQSPTEIIKEEKTQVPTKTNDAKVNPKETKKRTSKSDVNYTFVWLCVLSVFVVGLIIVLLLLWKNIKNAFITVNVKINRIDKSLEKSIQQANKRESSSSLPIKEIIQGPSKEDVLLWIKEEMKRQHPAQSASVPPVSTPKPQFDTDQVDCNWENGFFIMQPNDKPIFRIYQKENIFYYTLVESIKSSMPSMLISTENFIVVNKRTSDLPKGVEIVKEGIVVPNGNNQYRVDPNNKLIINVI